MSFLQSLAAAFKGGDGHVPLARSFTSPWLYADLGNPRTPFEYNSAVKRAYLDNPVAQRAVRLVAEGIGGAALVDTDPELTALVKATSAGQSLLETLASQLLLHGNAYVQLIKNGAGRPAELFALRPERMSVIAGSDGWPSGYAYKLGDKVLQIPLLDESASPNLIHIKSFHPADDHYGAGCLAAADQAVATHNAAGFWNRQLLENAARPSGALVYDAGDGGGLSPDQFDRLKAELTEAYAGQVRVNNPGSAGRIVVRFPAGLVADWATLPEGLRHGVLRLAAFQYRSREGGTDTAQWPPSAVAALWRPWRRLRLT